MVAADIEKIKKEADKGDCAAFLKYLNEHYIPAEKKLTLTDEQLKEENLKKTITTKFARIYHPDKNRNEERQVQILREEVMRVLNKLLEMFKGN